MCTLALVWTGSAQAQWSWSGTAGLDSQNRYRGLATGDTGPVLRASVMADLPWSAYAGASAIWRARVGGLASAEVITGFSGRLAALPLFSTLDAHWGWDVALHRTHYNSETRYDFTEAMAGLLVPGGAVRAWWSPHYFGGSASSLYTEADASRTLGSHWSVFAHAGVLHYGTGDDGRRRSGRTDAQAGASWIDDRFSVRLARDGLLAGHPYYGLYGAQRRPGWVFSASASF